MPYGLGEITPWVCRSSSVRCL